MPVCFIEGPSGIEPKAKRDLIQRALEILTDSYQIPDDRVYINEYSLANVGHTGQSEQDPWIIQTEPARVTVAIDAPPDLPIDIRRKMFADLSKAVSAAYRIKDMRDILIFLREHQIEYVANNGMMQTENPEFSSPATS